MNDNEQTEKNQNQPQNSEQEPSKSMSENPQPDDSQTSNQQNTQNSPDIMQVVSTLTAQVSALTEQVAALKSSYNPMEQNIVVDEGNPVKEEEKEEPGIDFDFTNFEDMDLLNIPKSHK